MPAQHDIFSLDGKTAIVTGASSGLGVTFAQVLAGRGGNVVVSARRADRLEEVAGGITKAGGVAVARECDVTEPGQVAALVDAAEDRFGPVDILVNNAGQVPEGGMAPERVPHEVFDQVVKVNLMGVWHGCREVGERMLRYGRKGSIINIASVAGLNGLQGFPAGYQATKAAVINLTRNLACSWADRGVRVNAIAPGWFPSEMTAPLFGSPVFLEHVKRNAPMGRIGEPSELAGALLLLASDASSFMTGHTLVVDGGLSASMGLPFMTDDVQGFFDEAIPDGLGRRITAS